MGVEIERKFLLAGEGWRGQGDAVLLRQGYLCSDPSRVVRVRVEGAQGTFTIKGKSSGATRAEFEYPIPLADAELLLPLCLSPLIDKTRHVVMHEGHRWEIDEFFGDNAPLIVAELELSSEDEPFTRPPWLGAEVTDDPRYFNSQLAVNPYARWKP